ncbi:hypothetical protein L3X38_014391 [Prunus dulcis]|uniref:Uncharacterized protein n=1 Tax=Prunus dulcis TaxID=3755 RepID=A0AAD4WQ82_PRUDU|nr:hypothetical protein L3X38_014391 [Prunus dulcis]
MDRSVLTVGPGMDMPIMHGGGGRPDLAGLGLDDGPLEPARSMLSSSRPWSQTTRCRRKVGERSLLGPAMVVMEVDQSFMAEKEKSYSLCGKASRSSATPRSPAASRSSAPLPSRPPSKPRSSGEATEEMTPSGRSGRGGSGAATEAEVQPGEGFEGVVRLRLLLAVASPSLVILMVLLAPLWLWRQWWWDQATRVEPSERQVGETSPSGVYSVLEAECPLRRPCRRTGPIWSMGFIFRRWRLFGKREKDGAWLSFCSWENFIRELGWLESC